MLLLLLLIMMLLLETSMRMVSICSNGSELGSEKAPMHAASARWMERLAAEGESYV